MVGGCGWNIVASLQILRIRGSADTPRPRAHSPRQQPPSKQSLANEEDEKQAKKARKQGSKEASKVPWQIIAIGALEDESARSFIRRPDTSTVRVQCWLFGQELLSPFRTLAVFVRPSIHPFNSVSLPTYQNSLFDVAFLAAPTESHWLWEHQRYWPGWDWERPVVCRGFFVQESLRQCNKTFADRAGGARRWWRGHFWALPRPCARTARAAHHPSVVVPQQQPPRRRRRQQQQQLRRPGSLHGRALGRHVITTRVATFPTTEARHVRHSIDGGNILDGWSVVVHFPSNQASHSLTHSLTGALLHAMIYKSGRYIHRLQHSTVGISGQYEAAPAICRTGSGRSENRS